MSDTKYKSSEVSDICPISIFIVTSTASRGVSFENVKNLIIQIPSFNLENQTLETVQAFFRARGKNNNDGIKEVYLIASAVLPSFYNNETREFNQIEEPSSFIVFNSLSNLYFNLNATLSRIIDPAINKEFIMPFTIAPVPNSSENFYRPTLLSKPDELTDELNLQIGRTDDIPELQEKLRLLKKMIILDYSDIVLKKYDFNNIIKILNRYDSYKIFKEASALKEYFEPLEIFGSYLLYKMEGQMADFILRNKRELNETLEDLMSYANKMKEQEISDELKKILSGVWITLKKAAGIFRTESEKTTSRMEANYFLAICFPSIGNTDSSDDSQILSPCKIFNYFPFEYEIILKKFGYSSKTLDFFAFQTNHASISELFSNITASKRAIRISAPLAAVIFR